MNLSPCWMLRKREICFVHLGKYGDIMIMLPAFKAVADQLGKPPICMVSNKYCSIFDGVSYVTPWVVDQNWWKGISESRKLAEKQGFNPIMVKWWDEPGATPPQPPPGEATIKVKIRGEIRTIGEHEWDSYQCSQWRYAGFTVQQMMDWPLVFDRRDPKREQLLRQRMFKTNNPKLLISLSTDGTSPFWNREALMQHIRREFSDYELVEIWKIKAFRIFDLLGLYDHAAGMITSDTATLHLAPASAMPYVAFINDGGQGSVPRGTCVASIRYKDSLNQGLFMDAFRKLREAKP